MSLSAARSQARDNRPRRARFVARDLALLLNPHARRVHPRLITKLSAALPDGARMDVSTSIEDAGLRIKDMIREGRRCILSGGGDGSLMTVIKAVLDGLEQLREEHPERHFEQPAVFPLKLGTGNGIAFQLGSHSDPRLDVERLTREAGVGLHHVQLVWCQEQIGAWGGVGWDAGVLLNYRLLQDRGNRFEGLLGYLIAGLVLTPLQLLRERTAAQRVKVISRGGSQYAGTMEGEIAPIEVPPGEVIFESDFGICAFGALPYYGYGIHAFPLWSQRAGHLHLRVLTWDVVGTILRLGHIWRGTDPGPGAREFLLERFALRLSRPIPLQLNGDSEGLVEEVEVEVTEAVISLADLREH